MKWFPSFQEMFFQPMIFNSLYNMELQQTARAVASLACQGDLKLFIFFKASGSPGRC